MSTRRTDYGIRAMLFMAHSSGELVKADAIAEGMRLPRTFVPQVLQDLQRARRSRAGVSDPSAMSSERRSEPMSALSWTALLGFDWRTPRALVVGWFGGQGKLAPWDWSRSTRPTRASRWSR